MGKKKKKKISKSVKKKKIETPLDSALKSARKIEKSDFLDFALKSSQKTQTDLRGMLKGITEGKGYYQREIKEGEKKVGPQLSYESKSKIVDTYTMEEIPISERKPINRRSPLKDPQKLATEKPLSSPIPSVASKVSPKEAIKPSEEDIYFKLEVFFEELLKGYNKRYNRWENSISNILAILRKMRKVTKINSENLALSINNLFNKIQTNLDQFKIKRDEIERVSGVNLLTMSSEFKKVLGLLELQIREYQLKKVTDELIHQQKLLS